MTASARPRTQDQWEFTEELLKRLQESTEERLPTTIDTFFNQHSIRLTHHAANLPSLANNLRGQLHPLLSGNIRRLDLHVKISLRPIHEPTSTHGRLRPKGLMRRYVHADKDRPPLSGRKSAHRTLLGSASYAPITATTSQTIHLDAGQPLRFHSTTKRLPATEALPPSEIMGQQARQHSTFRLPREGHGCAGSNDARSS